MPPLEITDTLIGRTIAGKYIIESFLGGGAMGSVYKARQFELDKVIAIKVMRAELTTDRSFVGRFRREAKAASKLSHVHSINVTDFGEEPDGLLYIVMEFVAGRDLELVMQEDGVPLPDLRIADILSQVLSAVAVAHDHGIVHRDLKPANVLIVPSSDDEGRAIEHVKVCDFGIASMRGADADPPMVAAVRSPAGKAPLRRDSGKKLTAIGALLGTPEYMSPEQASGYALDAASDIYSIGAILYELLTGRTVYLADTPEEMVLLQMSGTIQHPREVRPCNAGLAAVCMRALAKKPEDRYPSARAMRAELRLMTGSFAPPASSHSAFVVGPPTTHSGVTMNAPGSGMLTLTPTPFSAASVPAFVIPPPRLPMETLPSVDSHKPTMREGSGSNRRFSGAPTLAEAPSRKRLIAGSLIVGFGVAVGVFFALRTKPVDPPKLVEQPVTQTTSSATRPVDRASSTTASAADVVVDLDLPPNGTNTTAKTSTTKGLRAPPAAGGRAPASAKGAPEPAVIAAAVTPPPTNDRAPAAAPPTPPPVATPDPTPANTPAPQAAPSVVVAKPFVPDAARVMATVVAAARTSRANVASVVSHTSFDSCYRDVLRAIGHAEGGAGTAHLDVDEDGIISNVSVRLPAPLSPATACFASKLRGQRVSVPDTGAATADVSFALVPN